MASRTNLTRWIAALGLGLGTLACGGAESALPSAAVEETAEQAASAPLIELIANAPATVVHGGTRHFVALWTVNGQAQQLDYTESVLTDGLGHAHVDVLAVNQPAMDSAAESLFTMLQKGRQRTMYFARDFGIRDVGQFEANYTLVDTAQSVVVAGVTCERLLVTPDASPDRRYIVDVDLATGLVLRSREELLDGTLVTSVEYLTIDYAPDLTNVFWDEPINDEELLVAGTAEAAVKLGFNPRMPKVLPAGWQSTGLSKVVDPLSTDVWAKRTYSDGVHQIFFLVAKGTGPKAQLKNPPSGTPPFHADRVRKMAVGPWTLLEADLAQGRAIVLGRAADGVLEDLLQSAFF